MTIMTELHPRLSSSSLLAAHWDAKLRAMTEESDFINMIVVEQAARRFSRRNHWPKSLFRRHPELRVRHARSSGPRRGHTPRGRCAGECYNAGRPWYTGKPIP